MAKPGKYSGVIGGLPRLLNADAKQQERVEKLKAVLAQDETLNSSAAFAEAYHDARQRKAAVEALLKSIKDEIETITQMMADRFENERIKSVHLEGGASVTVHYEPYAQVANKEEFRLWCIKNGLERSLQLPWPATNSMMKAMLLDGRPEPDGVTCFSKVKLGYRKGDLVDTGSDEESDE